MSHLSLELFFCIRTLCVEASCTFVAAATSSIFSEVFFLCFAHFPLIFHSLLDFYIQLCSTSCQLCALLHSAPTIDLLIIAAFYSQFLFFFSLHVSFHRSIGATDQIEKWSERVWERKSIETHGHINMESVCIYCFRYSVDFLQSNTFEIRRYCLLIHLHPHLDSKGICDVYFVKLYFCLSFSLFQSLFPFVLRMTMIIITLKIAAITRATSAEGNELIDSGASILLLTQFEFSTKPNRWRLFIIFIGFT